MKRSAGKELVITAGFVAATQAISHWFPWNRALGDELKPPWSYIVGTAQIVIAFVVWSTQQPQLTGQEAAWGLCAVTGASGASVCGCYLLDWIVNVMFSKSVGRTDGRSVRFDT